MKFTTFQKHIVRKITVGTVMIDMATIVAI